MPKEIIKKFEKQYGKKKGKGIFYATANKEGRNPETFEKKNEDISILENIDILTESQKVELKKILNTIVEERVQEQTKDFIKKYTNFITEQAAKKLTGGIVNKLSSRINEEMGFIKDRSEKICRSVVCEASNKIAETKNKHRKLVEEFRATAPKLIENLAEKKAQELSEEAILAIEQNKKIASTFQGITKGLASVGYTINEDVEGKIKKLMSENLEIKTKLIKQERDLKLAALSEGLLPSQKKDITELLSECATAKSIEDKFKIARDKIMKAETIVENKVLLHPKKEEVINEEEIFNQLIGASKKYIENR
jgi:hypothetical protein